MILPVKEAELGQESKKKATEMLLSFALFLFSRKLFLSGAADRASY